MTSMTSLYRHLLHGAGSVLRLWPPVGHAHRPAVSDLDALRGDWGKIGQDFSTVLDREAPDSSV